MKKTGIAEEYDLQARTVNKEHTRMPGYRNRKSDKGQTERPYKNKTKEHTVDTPMYTGGGITDKLSRVKRIYGEIKKVHMDSTQMPQTVTHIACQNQYKKS